jgi:hypothetical protein
VGLQFSAGYVYHREYGPVADIVFDGEEVEVAHHIFSHAGAIFSRSFTTPRPGPASCSDTNNLVKQVSGFFRPRLFSH